MLDIETFGTRVDCIILQIGACYFDRNTGQIGKTFTMNVDPHDARSLGFKEDFRTMLWWIWQSKEAQNAVFNNPKPLMEVFGEFAKFAKEAENVFSHATFDFAIVIEAYKSVGLETPFHYKSSVDLRTLCKLAKIDLKKHVRVGIHHNGLDDCISQVAYTIECLKKLKLK